MHLNKPQQITGIILFLCWISMLSCHRTVLPSQTANAPFSFAAIADCQYCKIPEQGVRKYAKSVEKLKTCVSHLNTMDLTYAIHLGDFIDRDWKSFDRVIPIYNQLVMPHLHALGNHDYSVSDELKRSVPKRLNMPSKFHHFKINNWRFVVLDGNDVSFHAYPKDSKKYKAAAEYHAQHFHNSPKWNGAIGAKQKKWLRRVLTKAENKSESVAIFCHFPIYPENVHNLWNAEEIIDLIEKYSVVKLYLNGHNHQGNYGLRNGTHYLTLKGMVDTDESAYSVIRVFADRLELTGFGREKSRILPFTKE